MLALLFPSSLSIVMQPQRGDAEFERAYREYKATVEAYGRCEDGKALDTVKRVPIETIQGIVAEIPDPLATAVQGGRVAWSPAALASAFLLHERLASESRDAESYDEHKQIAVGILPLLRKQSRARRIRCAMSPTR